MTTVGHNKTGSNTSDVCTLYRNANILFREWRVVICICLHNVKGRLYGRQSRPFTVLSQNT